MAFTLKTFVLRKFFFAASFNFLQVKIPLCAELLAVLKLGTFALIILN